MWSAAPNESMHQRPALHTGAERRAILMSTGIEQGGGGSIFCDGRGSAIVASISVV